MNAGSATCAAKLAKILRPWLGGWISTASSATDRSSCIFCVKSISSSFSATSKTAGVGLALLLEDLHLVDQIGAHRGPGQHDRRRAAPEA
ncbi:MULTISPECIES: hypothetical protein [unclassified Streptomyces]|uniref:hypothetical protein n=1 Tax=unclassified Streptomyces TaxID=2593676 RepID=UPI0011642D9C|nr:MULTISPECIES: hypothetical protein [unclassified Streptomyces]NMI54344.1 hypothetical protein [Streptomyces sp. RLA2-12]QDO57010.1 hypothetical protein FNV59_00730 [Streptomyces sp. RLB1-8]